MLYGDLSDLICADKKSTRRENKTEIWGRFEKRRSRISPSQILSRCSLGARRIALYLLTQIPRFIRHRRRFGILPNEIKGFANGIIHHADRKIMVVFVSPVSQAKNLSETSFALSPTCTETAVLSSIQGGR